MNYAGLVLRRDYLELGWIKEMEERKEQRVTAWIRVEVPGKSVSCLAGFVSQAFLTWAEESVLVGDPSLWLSFIDSTFIFFVGLLH